MAQVITTDGETDFSERIASILQRDTLAPYFFIVVLDYALQEATKDTSTGFMLEKRQGSRKLAVYITDADFADDLALTSNNMEQAQLLLSRLEMAAETTGLHENCKKTEYILFNQDETYLKTLSGDLLKQVPDFKYLGSWIADSKKDMEVRIGLAWKVLNKLDKICKSKLERQLKIQFFRSTVETVLLYVGESWTLTNEMCRRLDGTYTRMLRAVLAFTWRDRITNNYLYVELSKITAVLKARRLRFIGHMWSRKEELVCQLLMWEPNQGTRKRGRPAITHVDQLRNDTGLLTDELKKAMSEQAQNKSKSSKSY